MSWVCMLVMQENSLVTVLHVVKACMGCLVTLVSQAEVTILETWQVSMLPHLLLKVKSLVLQVSCHCPRLVTKHCHMQVCLLDPMVSSVETWSLLEILLCQRTFQFLHLKYSEQNLNKIHP